MHSLHAGQLLDVQPNPYRKSTFAFLRPSDVMLTRQTGWDNCRALSRDFRANEEWKRPAYNADTYALTMVGKSQTMALLGRFALHSLGENVMCIG